MSHVETTLTHCANCGQPLAGRYCANCGQKAVALNPTLHDFLHDLTHELLHVDGKIFQSVRLLLTRPGYLSREWFEGRRARYVTPIRLYLIFSVLFFAASALAPSVYVNVTPEDRAEIERAPEAIQRAAEVDPRAVAERMGHWVPRAMFVLVPMFALLVSGVTRSAGRNYPQDLYFALHVHAAIFGVLALSPLMEKIGGQAAGDVFDLVAFVYATWYLVVALRVAYGGSRRRTFGRAAIVGLLYGIAIIAALVVVAMIAVFV